MPKKVLIVLVLLLVIGGGIASWMIYQDGLEPVALMADQPLFDPANPEGAQRDEVLEVLMPPSQKLDLFIQSQVSEPLVRKDAKGEWTGLLADQAWRSRNGKRWRFTLRTKLYFHTGVLLDATRLKTFLDGALPAVEPSLKEVKVVDPLTVDLRFRQAPKDLLGALATTPMWVNVNGAGTGPFALKHDEDGSAHLVRSDFFRYGPAGVAGFIFHTDPMLLEGHAWSQSLLAGRWAWTAFPGNVPPDDMAKTRNVGYDELRMSDGSVWFISRRMRRLHPDKRDWTQTRLHGIWRGSMDLKGEY